MLQAVEAGHVADQTHSVGVQLYAHKAGAAARLGFGDAYNAGVAVILEAAEMPENGRRVVPVQHCGCRSHRAVPVPSMGLPK